MGWLTLFLVVFLLSFLLYCVAFIGEIIALRKGDEDASAPRMVMYGQYAAIFACLFDAANLVHKYVHGDSVVVAWISFAVALISLFILTWKRLQLPKDFERLPFWYIKKQREWEAEGEKQ